MSGGGRLSTFVRSFVYLVITAGGVLFKIPGVVIPDLFGYFME